jgi:hypothetical protein
LVGDLSISGCVDRRLIWSEIAEIAAPGSTFPPPDAPQSFKHLPNI